MEGHLKLRQQYLEKPGRLFDPWKKECLTIKDEYKNRVCTNPTKLGNVTMEEL